MDRLIAANSVPLAQADTAPATGTPQYATDGNPASNIPATRWPAYAFNTIQDEIYNVIIAAGLTPDRTKWNQLLTAIQTMLQGSTTSIATDTGTANAYVIEFTPAITAPVPWAPFWFNVKTTNTGASTLNATGTVEPLVGAAHSALQGGELVAHGNALAYWNPTLASGAGSYVLLFCSGAPKQIAPAIEGEHAVQFGQVSGVVGSVRNLSMYVATASASATLTADEIVVETALGGLRYCLANFNKTVNLATQGAGGMDGNYSVISGFVALYAIYNPTTGASALLATNATSSTVPNVYGGSGMPSGYAASALVSVRPTNASGQFAVGYQRNRRHYIVAQLAFSGAAPTGYTPVSISTLVPKNAVSVGGTIDFTGTSGVIIAYFAGDASGVGEAHASFNGGQGASCPFRDVPLITPQTIFRALSGTGSSQTLYVSEYDI